MTSSSDFDRKINNQQKQMKQLAEIGLALSAEKNISKLLEMIVDEARDLSNADAGTLYTVDDDKLHLSFEIMQNDSIANKIVLPKVPLYISGRPNHSNVSSYTALTGETINIPDVYKASGFDFTGPKKYDTTTGYRSKSMIVIPMKNHENDIIGVLQLLNAKNIKTGRVVSFPAKHVNLIASLASQAAVALTNTQLIQDLKNLFYSFIKSIATAVDEKSPYTGGHIRRVVFLTMMIAEEINKSHDGPFKDIYFNEDEIEELRLAAWMHDVGKITTPEHVIDKSTKLETMCDRIFLIETRFYLIAGLIKNRYLKRKIELLKNEENSRDKIKRIEQYLGDELKMLYNELDFIKACNNTKEFMNDDKIKRIKNIAKKTYSLNNEEHYYLTEDEVKNLCIRKGTLTWEERKIIENHAEMTLKILKQIPFPKKLANVPRYAASHHEKLDGSGYPSGLTAKEMPFQLRIMVVADIFEALTAKDRPYNKPRKLSHAIKIMECMKKDKHIDPDIYDLFVKKRLFYDYAKKEMISEQIDL
ncbi:MAG TPA: HD domain-containing phosphohydrolase [Anaerolineae bacterium]|nr:HD domain-containing phosphohydrolase [Anaerolineae bacterium]